MKDGRARWPTRFVSSLIASAYMLSVVIVAKLVNEVVESPYLDEIFHIPQAQQYCRGEYMRYDPKLTTPPGLYAISVALAYVKIAMSHVLPGIARLKSCQTVHDLRFTTMLSSLVLPWVLADYAEALSGAPKPRQKIVEKGAKIQWRKDATFTSPMEALTAAEADPSGAARKARTSVALKDAEVKASRREGAAGIITRTLDSIAATINAHTVAILPPMWFFGFLYYTDIPSTLLVIAMLSAAKRKSRIRASMLGLSALTLRQTNIVWIVFAIGCSILDRFKAYGLETGSLADSGVHFQLSSLLRIPVFDAIQIVIQEMLPYTPLFAASGAFLYHNGSIVLGDRDNHKVSPHYAQPVYFAAFVIAFAWPTLLYKLWQRRTGLRTLLLCTVAFAGLSLLAIKTGTVTHPFLLADNRHYAFYVWRKVIGRTWWSRYALVAVYAPASTMCIVALSYRHSVFWIAGFVVCLASAIIPSPLIEPRYFMIPYIILRMSFDSNTSGQHRGAQPTFVSASLLEAAWAISINAFTIYLFLNKPFKWPDSEDWQRFMW